MSALDLSVIIISHGHAAMLPGCIQSLAPALAGLRSEIIVIDNLPGGTVAAALAGTAATVSANPRRLGFAANANRGIALSQGRHVLLLNPDTVHSAGALKSALDLLGTRPDIGILGCTLLNADGTLQQSYRQFPTPAVLLARGLAADHWPWRPAFYRRRLMENIVSDSPHPVDWVFGAFMLMRRRDFDRAGGMDEKFRLYYEDVDLCHRFRRLGLRTYIIPDLKFTHVHVRESAKKPFSENWRWHVRSALRYFWKAWMNPIESPSRTFSLEVSDHGSGRQAGP